MRTVVVGAGAVGLAVAQRLAGAGVEVWVLERHERVGAETSSRNSEVVHAGIYYATGSLKARLCVAGREQLARLIDRGEVAGRWTGKLIVAVQEAEIAELAVIAGRASDNGARPLHSLSCAELSARVPGLRGVAGLWSTGTGIVSAHDLMTWCRRRAERHGAEILLRHRLLSARQAANGWTLQVQQPDGTAVELPCDSVVNAAGLHADKVARLAVDDAALPRQVLVKGNYFDVSGVPLADTLVYPVPPKNLVGLGTHLTLDLAGQCRLGPDVEPATGTEDFAVDAARAAQFFAAASRFFPALRPEQLRPAYAGIRPKLATDRAADFYIAHESGRGAPGWVNLLGIESPGLTASLAIADMVADLLGVT